MGARISFAAILTMALVALMAVGTLKAQSTNMEIDEYLPLTTGDYFDYQFDITNFIQSMIDDDSDYSRSGKVTYKDVTTKYKVTIGGTETVTVGSDTLETYIAQKEIVMKFTIVNEEEETVSNWDISSNDKEWWSKSTLRPVRTESLTKTILTTKEGSGEYSYTSILEMESFEKKTFSKIDKTNAFPLKVGKTWSTLETYNINTTDKSRSKWGDYPFSDWSFEYTEETVSETTNYEVMAQTEVVTPVGNFIALKVRSQTVGGSDYDMAFIDKFGMEVQHEFYEEGTLNMIMKVKDWKFEKTKDTDGDGVIDIKDMFPNDKAASKDGDGDGHPDEWNEGMTEKDSSTGLKLDMYPEDSSKWKKENESSIGFVIALSCMAFITLLLLAKRKRAE